MAEKVVIKIKKVNGENVIRIKGNPESKYHINLMAQKLRLGEIAQAGRNQADKDVENKEVF